MTNKYVINSAGLYIEPQHLLLGTFATINHIKALINIEHLGGWVSVKYGGRGTAAKYR